MAAAFSALVAVGACGDGDPAAGWSAFDAGGRARDAENANDAATALDSGPGSSSEGGADAGEPAPPFVYFDVNHVLSTGQSLSVGALGTPALTLTQPYDNLMFAGGVIPESSELTSFVPLVEGDTSPGIPGAVETMSSGFANLVTELAREKVFVDAIPGQRTHDLLVSVHGVSGTPYAGLKQGTAPYVVGLAQVQAAHDLAQAAGKSYVVRAVTTVHGESDHINGNPDYEADLIEWQANYESDVKAITGQTIDVPMFQTQMSSWTMLNSTISVIPYAQLQAHIDKPGKIILVGPKYHLPYVADGVHLTNEGYRHMGEDYAKAYRRVILDRRPWEPLRPKAATIAGKVITVTFHVPAPPLVLDTESVTDPGNLGFEYIDESASTPEIVSVDLAGPDTVRITLSAEPTGQTRRLHYAAGAPVGSGAGPATGPRGNLRDSDATPSRWGYSLYNWCVHFVQPIL